MVPVVFWMFLSIFMIFYNLYRRSVGAGGASGARGARGASGTSGFLDVLKHGECVWGGAGVQGVEVVFWMFLSIFMIFYTL